MEETRLAEEIQRLKAEKEALILAHNYQVEEIQRVADHLGDSLELSRIAARAKARRIVFCGVRFMAETAKILAPDKIVLLPRLDAGCPMADMVDVQGLLALKAQHPDAMVVTYVNSTAEVKAVSDVCCTSANAVKVVQNVEAQKILFIPDQNLAAWVRRFTEKTIIPWDGYCYVHRRFTAPEVDEARARYPEAVIVVHPECLPEVIGRADQVLSTSGMVAFARKTSHLPIILGTEEGLIQRLRRENPTKTFLSLGAAKICRGMKVTRLEDLYQALLQDRYPIDLDPDLIQKARRPLERMLDYA